MGEEQAGSARMLASMKFAASDLSAGGTNPWAIGTATAMNAAVLALLIALGLRHPLAGGLPIEPPNEMHLNDFTVVAPSRLSLDSLLTHGGGGGGSNSLTAPSPGHLPPRVDNPVVSLQQPVLEHPLIATQSAINVPAEIKLPDDPSLQKIGVSNAHVVMLDPGGPGKRGGIGIGANGGDGPGDGPGFGPGKNGGTGGSTYSPGVGGVSNPVVTYAPIAEFSDEARQHKYEGVCIVSLIVDAQGNPTSLRVTRSLGMGLDEKALDAVRLYRFKPSLKNGRPVAAYASVEINFHLF
jgi:protein TonB